MTWLERFIILALAFIWTACAVQSCAAQIRAWYCEDTVIIIPTIINEPTERN